jgi:hypothetical protein
MTCYRRVATLSVLAAIILINLCHAQADLNKKAADRYRPLPAAWAGDWDELGFPDPPSAFTKTIGDIPAHEAVDPMIKSLLTPWGQAKMESTSYDDAPGSLCDPEGWFPFLNYGYGFALLASPNKITMIPVEADTEGIRRVYLKPAHADTQEATWNGDSIAHWEGDTLVIDTTGFNDRSWLGDDREPHTSSLHLVEHMRLIHDGQYLQVEDEISDAKALTASYKLTRYFTKYNASHLAAGPDRRSVELVCNEDPSPFVKEEKKTDSQNQPQR